MMSETEGAEVEALRADLADAKCACGHLAKWHSALIGCNAEDWDQAACDCRGDWLDAVLPLFAAREAKARAEALQEAADALEGGLGVFGVPQTLYDTRVWLRARAAARGVEGAS